MLKSETIKNFNGFGSGGMPGEYLFSQGMSKSQFGITPKWTIGASADNSTLTNLTLTNWFTQGQFSSTSYVYGFASDGRLYRTPATGATWTQQRAFGSSHGNGLIFDQKNRLLYANDQYLGKTDDGSAFTDNWKDFVLSTTDFRPMDTYEDWVVIGNVYQIALLNVTDDSFNANAFNIPSGFNIRCIKSGKNGILIGANFNNRGVVMLWDSFSPRAIAPWIWRNTNIRAIAPTDEGWIVFTKQDIFLTNGYSVQSLLSDFPDHLINDLSILDNLIPQGAELQGDRLLFWGTSARFNRQKSGLYILNLSTKTFEFVPVSNGVTYGVTGGAVFSDSTAFTRLSYTTSVPNGRFLGILSNSNPAQAVLITEELGIGGNEKTAEGVKLALSIGSSQTITPVPAFDISVKVCNKKRNIFGYGQTRAVSTQADILKIDGSVTGYNRAQVGDEVTILQGVNAGKVRHIKSIANQGTNTETWTLDSTLTSNTESGVFLNVSPFKLANKFSLTNLTELKELYFDVQNKPKGKKFIVKILIENMVDSLMLEIEEGQFIYNELSLKK